MSIRTETDVSTALTKLPGMGMRTLAIVSGKGGSGKTLFATALTLELDRRGLKVILVDGDVGTGGCSYFLGLSHVRSIQVGLTEMLNGLALMSTERVGRRGVRAKAPSGAPDSPPVPVPPAAARRKSALVEIFRDAIQPITGTRTARLLPIGSTLDPLDQEQDVYEQFIPGVLDAVLSAEADLVLVDCRGGIDRDTLAVCRSVDGVLLIAETDAASIQAGQRLVKLLSEHVKIKGASSFGRRVSAPANLVGFVINKAFADPSQLAQTGASFFRTLYLGAVPFDFVTTRRFIFGELPETTSIFSVHVGAIVDKLFPQLQSDATKSVFSRGDYDLLSVRDMVSVIGGRVCAGLVLLGFYLYLTTTYIPGLAIDVDRSISTLIPIITILIGLVGSMETGRRVVGRALRSYLALASKLLTPRGPPRKA